MILDFEKLGFKDITKDNPIHFIECLGEFFESVKPYSKRFYKKENGIITLLKVGSYFKFVYIEGICYYSKRWEKFNVNAPLKYIEEQFKATFNAAKLKLIERNNINI